MRSASARAVIAGGGLPVGLGGPLHGLGVHRDSGQIGQIGQIGQQARRRGERRGRPGPVDHPAQPRGQRRASHLQLPIPGRGAVPADTAVVPGPPQPDRADHDGDGLVPVGHELRLMARSALDPRTAMPAVAGQQPSQQRPAQRQHRRADRHLHRLQAAPAPGVRQLPCQQRGQPPRERQAGSPARPPRCFPRVGSCSVAPGPRQVGGRGAVRQEPSRLRRSLRELLPARPLWRPPVTVPGREPDTDPRTPPGLRDRRSLPPWE